MRFNCRWLDYPVSCPLSTQEIQEEIIIAEERIDYRGGVVTQLMGINDNIIDYLNTKRTSSRFV